MARTKKIGRSGRGEVTGRGHNAPRRTKRHYGDEDGFVEAQKKAERRERILADRRRIEAKWRPKIPEAKKVNFEDFKNHFQEIEEPEYAIEVLMAAPNLQAQIRREQGLRRKEHLTRMRESWMYEYGYPAPYVHQPEKAAEQRARREKRNDASQLSGSQMHRVRIQSQPVLGHLTSLLNESFKRSTPRTFVRPFKALVYFQPKMKAILSTLEEKWGDVEELGDVSGKGTDCPDDIDVIEKPNHSSASMLEDENGNENQTIEDGDDDDDNKSIQSVDSNADDIENVMDGTEALRDMRCYVEFVDKEIMPLYHQFDGNAAPKVKFDDLWALFRVGDLIYMPAASESGGRYHEVWRIYRVKTPEVDTSYPESGWEFFADEFQETKSDRFKIYAYYIDHDGTGFGAVRHTFEIETFPGERAVDSLEVFPIRYWEDHENVLHSLKAQGRSFQKFLEASDRHQSYSAWTLTRNPPNDSEFEDEEVGEILRDEKGDMMRHPEFVESDVIVDMTEAYQRNPDWRPQFHSPSLTKSIRCNAEEDSMAVQQWFDGARNRLAFSSPEMVQTLDGVETWQRRENLNLDQFLRQRVRGTRHYEKDPSALSLRDEDLVLLPKRMFAYALRERRFVPVNINFLQPIRREGGVFESLSILQDYKDIVRGLVVSHFQKKVLERRYAEVPTEGPSQDIIQGKGRGLVVLLHGVPGVGKTATAEAVAVENRKPLFVITCGDLGLTPSEVETSLINVFRLAHLWDCVLLLDEADVFLTQRSKDDMNRNALVSVFLRVLEYYNGLLFLTTNRVGSIDDAFKSRIHMSLYYPPLDKTQTRDIFRLNITKLREIERQRCTMTGDKPLVIKDDEILAFASKHYEDNARLTACWNGRQIRNAFQVASSLAHYKYLGELEAARRCGQAPPAGPVLDRSLFEKVQMSTVSFDKHMQESRGFDVDLPLRNAFKTMH
ncbi:hypothetical protein JX265_010131 [Neoarthrinium moseri]|uniref:AAA+ ATPase domain-containing protein n=1 Tax=Neoarthrinium moseri TaxID=1658444 RepID=A0A9P9WF89_9PEZI|nr:hypothetical protein JX265_010131 [Neoarthrinium moseri]